MTTLVTRAQWGARARKQGTTSIVAHPSITCHYVGGGWKFPWDHASCDDKVRGIQADHMDNRGWSDIAYNYLVCPHDYVYEGRGFDRRSSANGYEAANNASFAICALWGETSENSSALPDGIKFAYLYAFDLLQDNGGATSVIKGHRDWKSTDCPGDQIYAWIKLGCPSPLTSILEDDEMLSKEAQRQVATTVVACIEQECRDGQSIHELVQSYSAFNALHTDQVEAGTSGDVEFVLKDDFQNLEAKLNDVTGQLATLTDLVRGLANKS